MALSHYVSSYENVQNVNVFKTILQVTIFKARQKIIMKSCKHNTVSNRNKYMTLPGESQQQRGERPPFRQDPATMAAAHTWIPLTACFIFSSRALFSGL